MADRNEFLAGLILGGLLGVGIGMLLAPRTGHETREKILGKADVVGDRVRDRIRDRAQEVSGRLKTRATEVRGRVRESAGDIASKVRDTVDEQTRRIRIAYERDKDVQERPGDEPSSGDGSEQN